MFYNSCWHATDILGEVVTTADCLPLQLLLVGDEPFGLVFLVPLFDDVLFLALILASRILRDHFTECLLRALPFLDDADLAPQARVVIIDLS